MIVNAEVDSMGENIDGGVEISSAPSPQQSSDLERTQAKLRETFNAAEKYRKELEFLQKGGDPLDLKLGNAATVSLQSTSQFVTSEVKGNFAVTASPHGDSVESSGRLGAPSANEPNSADNLMLFDGQNNNNNNNDNTTQAVSLEIPKKAYKRRVRSRPNRDGPRAHKNLASNSCSDVKVNGIQTQKSTLGQPLTSDENIDTQMGSNRDLTGQINDCKSGEPLVKKGFESKSTCSQTNYENNLVDSIRSGNSNGNMELMEGNNVNSVKDDKILKNADDHSIPCPTSNNENGSTLKEKEDFGSEQNACSQNNLAIKEHEESILEKARIIEEKRKKITGLSSVNISSENNHRSHWHFVLEEMSWLANDFAQERIWKATTAAQISSRAAYNSRVRLKQQNLIWKQKEVASSLAEAVMKFWHTLQVGLEFDGPKKDSQNGLHQYGLKFLEYNKSSHVQYSLAHAPKTPDRISDFGIIDILWDDNLTEEKLFYTVPPGAIEAYRNSIESHLLQIKKTGCSMQEVVDATEYDVVADDIYEEEEEETNTYYLPGAFEGSRSTKPTQKKRKHFRPSGPKSYETGLGPQQPSVLSGKRPANSINGSIPTKRIRTGSRPRFSGNSGFIHGANRADASNGDTNSFQDEQSLFLHVPNNNMEAESVGDYEKQLQFDLSDGSNRPKKKKKTKHPHPGSLFENRWQLDSSFQNDQKDHSKRRQFDSNGNSVASQTSNMSNSNKFIKLLVRDRGRKSKSLKTPVGQQGSGTPWSLFEDQALVVLVHDMGANWELISDALNSLLHLKCISRNSKECKERHKILMDTNGDSAEDSGSSQPYPSTLPNIPEGSARQLFQRLQGPMEEETLKSHFEKIIMISQKQHYRKAQKDNQDPKQLQQPHVSHADALSEIHPNNLIGGYVLTPLDLCDTISPSPDFVPVGYHTAGLPVSNHVTAPMTPGSSATATAPISPSVRDGRYGIPRVSVEDQHRMNQMSARNMQQPPTDRGAHLGVINRNIAMTRPAFQGINHPQSPGVRPHLMRPNQNMRPDLQMPHHPPHAGMHFIKERQIHQQRLLQQQFATSNPIVPPVQPVSSPQSSTQIQNLKQLPRQQLPPPPPGRTGGGRGSGPLMNGFSGSQSISQQKRYPGQPGQLGQPQTTSLKQLQTDSNNHAPSVTTTSSNNRQPQKLVGQSQSQSQAAAGQSKVQPFDDSSGAVSSEQGVKKQWQQQPSS